MRNSIGGKRNFAGCGPFDGADEEALELGDIEVWVRFVAPGVTEHRRVNTAFSVRADPVHGFVPLGIFAVGVGENVEVFERGGGAMLAVGELFGFVLP